MDPYYSRFDVLSYKLKDLHGWVEPNRFDHVSWECMFWGKTHVILSCELHACFSLDLSYSLWLVIIAWYMLYGSLILLWCYFLPSHWFAHPTFQHFRFSRSGGALRGGLGQFCIRDFLFFGWCVDTHVIYFPLHTMALLFVHSFGLVARGGLDWLLLGCIALIHLTWGGLVVVLSGIWLDPLMRISYFDEKILYLRIDRSQVVLLWLCGCILPVFPFIAGPRSVQARLMVYISIWGRRGTTARGMLLFSTRVAHPCSAWGGPSPRWRGVSSLADGLRGGQRTLPPTMTFR